MSSDDPADEPEEKGILAPDELDITDHPKVESLSEGRYVVSAEGTPDSPDAEQREQSSGDKTQLPAGETDADETADETDEDEVDEDDTDDGDQEPTADNDESDSGSEPPAERSEDTDDTEPAEPPAVELTQQTVSQFLAESLTSTETSYGFDATVNIEGDVKRGRMSSDDVAETLEGLLRWYAEQTTDEMEPEAALGIILAGSTLEVEYPVQSVYAMLKQYELGPDDSISDLLAAIREEGSFTVPPSDTR
ncbi:DUF7500 family protein [Halonotius roseus]|uniref:Flagella cluster protein n=1 Tax=Halonotius roseus TaxID=2511997 RepID=A0A544QNN7_9EURY|nr:hypothetical protein [Halonotius roseus]TQQ80475.1 hypothetical protein EWF95_08270 [Halonotius roseus]